MTRPIHPLLAAAGLAGLASGVLATLTLRERRTVDAIRTDLGRTTGPTATFSEDMVAGMPAPARRFFLHAIAPGTPLARVAHIEMSGQIKPSEQMDWAPFSFFLEKDARVETVDDHRFVVYPLDDDESRMTLTVDDDGRLVAGVLPRWGNQTDTGQFAFIPFGGAVQEERTFDGYTIAARASAGWWYGTDRYREFFRVTLDHISYYV